MKYFFYLAVIFFISCNSKEKGGNPPTIKENTPVVEDVAPSKDVKKAEKNICWTGTLNSKIPIFLHYQIVDNLLVGEITYLNTEKRKPIKIIGTLENENYRILEFEKNGNITGIISGIPTEENFNGSWFSPKTRKQLSLELTKSDSIIYSKQVKAKLDDIYGKYHYQYSESGNKGDLELTKIDNQNSSLEIFSMTGAPGRNIANIKLDEIKLDATEFTYSLPESNDCEFKAQYYKDFVYISYVKEDCEGQFGHNATIEGIFVKM